MRFVSIILPLVLCFSCTPRPTAWQAGDLLFQSLDSEFGGAIEAVTESAGRYSFSHVGMLAPDSAGGLQVVEAIGCDVRLTPLDSFLRRSAVTVAARVKADYRRLTPAAIAFAVRQIGTPYDEAYLYDNGRYYCSELIYDAFLYANDGRPFFTLEPMTFKAPGVDSFPTVWVRHYEALGMPIPEGQPGCNPGGLSRSDKLEWLAGGRRLRRGADDDGGEALIRTPHD